MLCEKDIHLRRNETRRARCKHTFLVRPPQSGFFHSPSQNLVPRITGPADEALLP
jgi:hypothetical protein